MEEFKAWSQNLGHEQVSTTFTSYGQVAGHRQAELIRNMAKRKRSGESDNDADMAKLAAIVSTLLAGGRRQA